MSAELKRVLALEENIHLPIKAYVVTTCYPQSIDDQPEQQCRYFLARNIETVQRQSVLNIMLATLVDTSSNRCIIDKIAEYYPEVLCLASHEAYEVWLKRVDINAVPYRLISFLVAEAAKWPESFRSYPVMTIEDAQIPNLGEAGERRAIAKRALRKLLPAVVIGIIVEYL